MASLGRHIGAACTFQNLFRTAHLTATSILAGLAISDPDSSWSGKAFSALTSIGLSYTLPEPVRKAYYTSTALIAGFNSYFGLSEDDPDLKKLQTISTDIIQGVGIGFSHSAATISAGFGMLYASEDTCIDGSVPFQALILTTIYGGGTVLNEVSREYIYELPFVSHKNIAMHIGSFAAQAVLYYQSQENKAKKG